MSRHGLGQQYVLVQLPPHFAYCLCPPAPVRYQIATFHWIEPPVTSVCPFSQGVPIIPFL